MGRREAINHVRTIDVPVRNRLNRHRAGVLTADSGIRRHLLRTGLYTLSGNGLWEELWIRRPTSASLGGLPFLFLLLLFLLLFSERTVNDEPFT